MVQVPPLKEIAPLEKQDGSNFSELVQVMRLLLGDGGCPWDQAQTPQSLKRYVLEEACEVLDAIDSGDEQAQCEELGDLALQVAFLGELARTRGQFGPDDIHRNIVDKLIERHPHVFGDSSAEDAEQVLRAWEAQKDAKRGGPKPLVDRLPKSFPALARAQDMSRRASVVGFDWDTAEASYSKVDEEIIELREAVESKEQSAIHWEYGDLLFALVNYGRHLGLDAEQALNDASSRFAGRFAVVEKLVEKEVGGWPVDASGKATRGLSLELLDGFWDQAKLKENQKS